MHTLLAALALATPGQTAPEMRLMRFPTVHGENVVFTYASDLWVVKKDGGFARRLTSHPGTELRARISPDGKWVAFTGQYDGGVDVYVLPIEGGEPKRLTYEPEADNVIGWTPDGKIAYTSIYGSTNDRMPRLWYVDPKGGMPIRTQVAEAQDGSFTSDGGTLVYNRTAAHNRNWRRYRGGSQGRIGFFKFATNEYWEKPSGNENSWFPMAVGKDVYYISDKALGTTNLYRYGTDDKQDVQVTKFDDADIKWPATDGKTIVFERDGYLYAYDIASGGVDKINPKLRSDFTAARPQMRKLGNQINGISLSPSAARVAVSARGEMFTLPVKQGDIRNLTSLPASREGFPAWSPDGKTIAFASDKSGTWQIYTVPQLGGEPKQLGNHSGAGLTGLQWSPDSKYLTFSTWANDLWIADAASGSIKKIFANPNGNSGDYDWSPDSKWVAYVDNPGKNLLGAIFIYDVASGEKHQVTDGFYSDSSVTFDMSGKYLYFVSQRTFGTTFGFFELSMAQLEGQRVYMIPLSEDTSNPLVSPNDEEPVEGAKKEPEAASTATKIDFADIGDRAIVLPMPPGNYQASIGLRDAVLVVRDNTLIRFDLKARQATPLMEGAPNAISFNPARTKLAYLAGNTLGVVDVRPGVAVGEGRVDIGNVEGVVDPKAEWKEMLWDAWRYQKDNFYDKDMLGLDWLAIGKKYEKYLPYVMHRSEFSYVLGLMIGELGTSHSYVQGGEVLDAPAPIGVGTLGADYEASGGKLRFKKIYKGLNFEEPRRGPLGEPGVKVKEGDYLLAIDGTAVDATTNPHSLLVGKVNRYVTLTVNSTPTMEGSRKVRVRTIGSESQLRYAEWVKDTRKKVSDMSGGRIGYMHIPDTQFGGVTEFAKGYYSQTDKDAMVVDERWNGGGFIQPWFVDTLARKVYAGIQSRNNVDGFDMVAIAGPKAMLINEYSGSGGDFFPYMFKHAGLGPLIGNRTVGGLVGIQGYYTLMDGGQVSSPEFAFYDLNTGEWIAENKGIAPDKPVDYLPNMVAVGRDPQLEEAVKYLLAELEKSPPRALKREDFPRVKKTGGG